MCTVIDDVENNRAAGWINGKRAVVLVIRRQPGANILETIDGVINLIPQLSSAISPAIDIRVGLDRAQTIRASVHDVEFTLVLSVGLVVMVVFMFLRSVRATIIPSVAVPLSLLATFGVMYLLGYSLDNLSLMALTISTGFVVDDAIVVTENVSRFIEEGEGPFEAALKGAKQIGFTIVSITVSLLAVFIPILMMGGIIGRLFREFAVTLSIAIAVSAVISLTLTPMMCSQLLKHEPPDGHGRAYKVSERFFQSLVDLYAAGLRWVLDHQWVTLGVFFATLGLTVYLFIIIPKGLFPQQDTGTMMGTTDASQDISFPAMKREQEAVNDMIKNDPDVKNMIAFIAQGNTGTCFIELQSDHPRPSTDAIIGRLRPKLGQIPGIMTYLQSVQDVRIGGRPSRTQYQYSLEDANLKELNEWAPKMLDTLKKLPELKDVATDLQTQGLQIDLGIDRDTASELGILPQNIDDVLSDAFGQRQVATTYTDANQYHVVVEMKPSDAAQPDAIDKLYVASANGGQVPLGMITKVGASMTSLSVAHQSQFPAVTLSFNVPPGVALGDAVDGDQRRRAQDPPAPEHPRELPGHGGGLPDLARKRVDPDPRRARRRLHRPRGALREPDPPDHHPLDPPLGGRRRAPRAPRDEDRLQHHRADRHHPAHRHREEERDHDDRLRARGGARPGPLPPRRHLQGLPPALPPHPDDDARRAARRRPARDRHRHGLRDAPAPRHRHRGRAPHLADADPLHDPRHLPDDGPRAGVVPRALRHGRVGAPVIRGPRSPRRVDAPSAPAPP